MATAPVTLHIYYVGNNDTIESLSKVTQDWLGQGGIFHGAVEIFGREWSFGGCDEGSGVFQCPPRSCTMHRYRESVFMGDCNKSEQEVFEMIKGLMVEWQGRGYSLLRRNCCSFSREFCLQLGVGEIPEWVYALAETGAALEDGEEAIVGAVSTIEADIAVVVADAEGLVGLSP